MSEITIFLDANVFLHYRRFDEIDWLFVTKADGVEILLLPVTLRELNTKKDSGTAPKKIRERAKAALSVLERAIDTEIRPAVRVIGIPFEPTIDFAANRLNPNLADDWLLASIIEYRSTSNSSRGCVLVTADLGLRLKCKAHSIEAISLPDELRLPEEEDQDAKKIRQLEQEMRALKAAAPTLSLAFPDSALVAKFELSPGRDFDRAGADGTIEDLRRKHPKLRRPAHPKADDTASASTLREFARLFEYSEEDVDSYNAQLDSFFVEYREALEGIHDGQDLSRRSFVLKLELSNAGTSPAHDIVVKLHFPDGFALIRQADAPSTPDTTSLPCPPIVPLKGVERFSQMSESLGHWALPNVEPVHSRITQAIQRNSSGPSIRRSNSYDVEYPVKKVNHRFSEILDPLVVVLPKPGEPISFGIQYEIHAANLPVPAVGILHVVISARTI